MLSSEQATKLVEEVLAQKPRLYCFFDINNPVSVNAMKEAEPEKEEEIEQSIAEMSATRKSRFRTEGNDKRNHTDAQAGHSISDHTGTQPDRDGQNIQNIDERTAFLPEENKLQNSGMQQPENSINLSIKERTGNKKSQPQKSLGDIPRLPIHPANVPDHLSPNDIIEEEDMESPSPNRGFQRQFTISKEDEIQRLMVTDEFRTAAQSVLDDLFISMIHEAVVGKTSLADRDPKISHRQTLFNRGPINRLRSQIQGGIQGGGGLSVSNTKL